MYPEVSRTISRTKKKRNIHDGLRDLPCEPGRYDWSKEADATKRITAGDVVPARIDQVLEPASFSHVDVDEEDSVTQILAYTHGTGVPVGIDIDKPEVSIERGDEVEVRIEEVLENSATGTIDHIISTDGRVTPPTIEYVGDEADESGGDKNE